MDKILPQSNQERENEVYASFAKGTSGYMAQLENDTEPKWVLPRLEKRLIELEAKLDRLIELMSNREETK